MKLPRQRFLRHWTADDVIDDIRKLSELSAKHIQRLNPGLYGAALRYFTSWKVAVESAGYEYAKVAKRRLPGYWSNERVISEIRTLSQKHSNYVRRHHTDLYSAALRLFTTWRSAVEQAGFDYDEVRKGWISKDSESLDFRKRRRGK